LSTCARYRPQTGSNRIKPDFSLPARNKASGKDLRNGEREPDFLRKSGLIRFAEMSLVKKWKMGHN
jgi:hypothetical protein